MDALNIQDLCVDFGKFRIDNLNLNIRRGAITGLIGANGAGKSTLIKMIMRAQDADSGKILYNGKPFKGNEVEILSSVACVFDSIMLAAVKPKRVIKHIAGVYPKFDMAKYKALVQKFNLPQDLKISKYSFGMKKKLAFVIGLCQNAALLILDEPTSGVDPYDRNELTSLIQEYMVDENHTVLFSTHITEDLDKIADYIVMIDNGKIILDSDKESLTESYRIVRCATMTDEMRAGAIGVKSDMFGYTFVTKDKSISGDGVQSKVPTVEELFVHLLDESKNGSRDFSTLNDNLDKEIRL